MIPHFQRQVLNAATAGQALRLRGGGSKDFYGQPDAPGAPVTLLDLGGYRGIVSYEPTELVISARCGTRLSDIEATLAEQRQMLAFEPPRFGPDATIGGCVAAGLSGPRRQAAGSVRDFVLGASLLDGRGQVLRFGGQVMKNVAGYDVSRVLAGSLGTLGAILDVSLKVMPVPVAACTLQFEVDESDALARLNQWAGQPLPITASAWQDGVLHLRLAGADAAVKAARARLGGIALDAGTADAFWLALREQSSAFFAGATPLWRLSLPSTGAALGPQIAGAQLIEWGGAQRWWKTDAPAPTLRALAAAAGGHATLFRAPDALRASAGVFQPLAPALLAIQRRLKAEFDPAGIFNPGRLYPDL